MDELPSAQNLLDQVDEKDFMFCYTKGCPQTLVMLKAPHKMPELLFVNEYFFVWVSKRNDQEVLKARMGIETILIISFYHFESPDDLIKALRQQINSKAVIVMDLQLFEAGLRLDKLGLENVLEIFFYCKGQKQKKEFYQVQVCTWNLQTQKELDKWQQQILVGHSSLVDTLRGLKLSSAKPKKLNNFVFISDQTQTSQILIRTLHSLLNQKIDQETTKQINHKFKQLIEQLQKVDVELSTSKAKTQRQYFFTQLQKQTLTDKEIVELYVLQTFLYKKLNKLLRAHRHPTEIFYIQPYLKKLFQVIHKYYKLEAEQEKLSGLPWSFTVYRGGLMSKEELQKFKKSIGKGEIVQNLGFTSTTLIKQKAKFFLNNVVFQIKVTQSMQEIGRSDYGFASLEKWDMDTFSENEVLFNPMNCFQIIDVVEGQKLWTIYLKYQIFLENEKQKCELQSQQKQSKQKREVQANILKMQRKQKYLNECQGNSLTNGCYDLPEGFVYWHKYEEQLRLNLPFTKYSQQYVYGDEYEYIIYRLRQSYCFWNKFIYRVLHQKQDYLLRYMCNNQFNRIRDFFSSLNKQKHRIAQKFQKMLGTFPFHYLPQYPRLLYCLLLSYDSAISYESQYKFFEHYQHEQQNQLVSKQIDLSNQYIDDDFMETPQIHERFVEYIKIVRLNNNCLKQIPAYIFNNKQLQQFQARSNLLQILPKQISNMTKLTRLSLRNNQISELPEEIKNMCELVQLQLQQNKITILPAGLFQLTKLRKLQLNQNNITDIPEDIFKLIQLKRLQLCGNKLTSLPNSISNLKKLERLTLESNELCFLPQTISGLVSLIYLSIGSNKIQKLPKGVSCLANLKYLWAGRNKLAELPQEISKLSNLTNVQLDNNKISLLPDGMFELVNLEFLNLSFNQILRLPLKISNLHKLKQLQLDNNQLTQIPKGILSLANLQELSINNNMLQQLPQGIHELPKLKVYYKNNPMKSIPQQKKLS